MKRAVGATAILMILAGCASTINSEELGQPKASSSAEAETTQAPEAAPTFELSNTRVSSELCKFVDETPEFKSRLPKEPFNYFPNVAVEPYFLPNTGEISIGLVFLDWADKKGTSQDVDYYTAQAEMMTRWYASVSQNKLNLNWQIGQGWNQLEGSWENYVFTDNTPGGDEARVPREQWFVDEAVAASDDSYDYSDIDLVVFAIPRSGTLTHGPNGNSYSADTVMTSGTQGMAYDVFEGSERATVVRSQEGSIGNWVVSGTTFQHTDNKSTAWIHWAHEMGHMLGYISHMGVPNPPSSDTYYQNTMYGVDLFADQWQVTRVVSSWTAWVAGWLDDDQVWCVDAEDITDEIFAINSFRNPEGQTKSLIIRTGQTTGLVIESRDWNAEFDFETPLSKKGFYNSVVMYSIDSSRHIADGSLMAMTPVDKREHWDEGKWPPTAFVYTDIYFHEGQSLDFGELRIEPISLQDGVDFVRISRRSE